MKILLAACNAKYIHSNLAVFNLKACAKEYDSNVVLREYTINQQKDDILKDIYRCHPDVICISCYIWNRSPAVLRQVSRPQSQPRSGTCGA